MYAFATPWLGNDRELYLRIVCDTEGEVRAYVNSHYGTNDATAIYAATGGSIIELPKSYRWQQGAIIPMR